MQIPTCHVLARDWLGEDSRPLSLNLTRVLSPFHFFLSSSFLLFSSQFSLPFPHASLLLLPFLFFSFSFLLPHTRSPPHLSRPVLPSLSLPLPSHTLSPWETNRERERTDVAQEPIEPMNPNREKGPILQLSGQWWCDFGARWSGHRLGVVAAAELWASALFRWDISLPLLWFLLEYFLIFGRTSYGYDFLVHYFAIWWSNQNEF